MADFRDIVKTVLNLADKVNEYLPAAPASQAIIDLARNVDNLIAGLGDDIPLDKQQEAQAARRLIAERVTAKSKQLSSDLRG